MFHILNQKGAPKSESPLHDNAQWRLEVLHVLLRFSVNLCKNNHITSGILLHTLTLTAHVDNQRNNDITLVQILRCRGKDEVEAVSFHTTDRTLVLLRRLRFSPIQP